MKRLVSLGVAFILFLGSAFGLVTFVNNNLNVNSSKLGMWVSKSKFSSYQFLNANMSENDMVVFGSSEFRHGRSTQFHPVNMLKDQKNQMVVIGREYYQSLSHAITLSALAPELKNKKVTLILSPQWFTCEGVNSKAYAKRFSENNYIAMLNNTAIPLEVKEYMVDRTEELLKCNPDAYERVVLYDNEWRGQDQNLFTKLETEFAKKYESEKAIFSAVYSAYASGVAESKKHHDKEKRDVDWDLYRDEAIEIGIEKTNDNFLNVSNSFFDEELEPKLDELKDCKANISFDTSPEYDDLRCFLDVCKANDIEVLIISAPINAKWYDYAGFTKDRRDTYYANIRELVSEYKVSFADLSVNEYTPGYFFDTVHFGWEGWVDVNEAIYRFQTSS